MSNNKKPGLERPYTHKEFLSVILGILKEKKPDYFDKLDYIVADGEKETITNSDVMLHSDTHFGGNEGIYTNFRFSNNGKKTYLFVMKTLGESDEDYISMHVLAANICLVAMDYIRSHDDEFNWSGYNVSYVKDGETHPYMWCSTAESAFRNAKELRDKRGMEVIIRDNATREILSDFPKM